MHRVTITATFQRTSHSVHTQWLRISAPRCARAGLACHWRHMGRCRESPKRLGAAGDAYKSRDLEQSLAEVGGSNHANGRLLATDIRKHCVDISVHFHELRVILAQARAHLHSAASCYRSKKSTRTSCASWALPMSTFARLQARMEEGADRVRRVGALAGLTREPIGCISFVHTEAHGPRLVAPPTKPM